MSFEEELVLIQSSEGFRTILVPINETETALYGLVPGVRQWLLSAKAIRYLESRESTI